MRLPASIPFGGYQIFRYPPRRWAEGLKTYLNKGDLHAGAGLKVKKSKIMNLMAVVCRINCAALAK